MRVSEPLPFADSGLGAHATSHLRQFAHVWAFEVAFALALLGCGPSLERPLARALDANAKPAEIARTAEPASTESRPPLAEVKTLDTEDILVGTGATAEAGRRVRMSYVGRLLDGTEFDRSRRRPFEFQLGAGEVIAGWDRGIQGMRVGGKRRLVIPAELGYGERGMPPTIPPNATLVFDVELLDVL